MKKIAIYILCLFFGYNSIKGQDCYTVIESNTGISDLYEQDKLNKASCDLKTFMNTCASIDFKIFGCDFYPILHYVEPIENKAYKDLFDEAITELDLDHEQYFMLTKEIYRDGKIGYRLHIKFPTKAPFDELNPIEKEAIEKIVLNTINEEAAKASHSLANNTDVEVAGIEKLLEIFKAVKDGTFQPEDNIFELAGFEEVPVTDGLFLRTGAKDEGSDGPCYIFDQTGLQVDDGRGGFAFYRDQLEVAPNTGDALIDGLTHGFILTDEENTTAEFNEAGEKFKTINQKIITWIHFYKTSPSAEISKVYIKYGDNLTDGEAAHITDFFFLQTMQLWMPEIFGEPGSPPPTLREVEAKARNSANCGFDWKWGKNCIFPELADDDFRLAIGVGLLDGLLGSIQFLYEAGKGVKEIGAKFWNSTTSYAGELLKYGLRHQSILKVFEKTLVDATTSVANTLNEVVELYESLTKITSEFKKNYESILQNIVTGVKNWMGELLTGQKGPGYDIGVIAFDVILTGLSGGTAAGSKFLPQVTSWLHKLGNKGADAGGMIAGLLSRASSKVDDVAGLATKIFRCKILGKGCFVAGTPVLAAGMLSISIDNLALGDAVYAHSTINQQEQLTATIDNGIYDISTDRFTSPSQKAVDKIGYEAEQWHQLSLELPQANGHLSKAQLIRPQSWLDQQEIHKIGDKVWISMPEQGLNGYATITSLAHFRFTKIPEENSANDYELQPITGIFEHTSNDVWELIFDNGDTLGVTAAHPVYSEDVGDWRLAGELTIGEVVKTMDGTAILLQKTQVEAQRVFNLEVREVHNFLVGDGYLLVHNLCSKSVKERLRELGVGTNKHKDMSVVDILRLHPQSLD